MQKQYIASILLALQIILLSACSFDFDFDFDSDDIEAKHPLLYTRSYSTEINGVSVHLSLHPLDEMEDILQVDVMIHQVDGSGPSFEVQNASLEESDGLLSFDWTDGFGNKGTAELMLSEDKTNAGANAEVVENTKTVGTTADTKDTKTKNSKVQLVLKVDEVVNERNMMFIKEYELTPTDENQASQLKPSTEEGVSNSNEN